MPPGPEATPRRRLAPALAALVLAAAGCGSLPVSELPPAATPAPSPQLAAAPAGRVVEAGTAGLFGPQPVRAAGRTFRLDSGAGVVRALEDGREVARASTGLQPAALALVDEDRQLGVLSVRERVLELFDARTLERTGRADAGTGPTNLVSDGGNYLYVTDTTAGAILVFRIVPELRLLRRYRLDGSPYAIAFDPAQRRLWVTLTATNELVELSAGRRPRELRRFPAVRRPDAVAVEAGRVAVYGAAEDVVQLLEPPPLERTR